MERKTLNRLRVWSLLYGAVIALCMFAVLGIAAFAQEPEAAATTTDGGLSVSGILGTVFQEESDVLYAMLIPGFIVYVLSVVIQPLWSPKLKQFVTYAVCFVVAAAYVQFFTDLRVVDWDGAPRVFVITAVVARGYYQLYKGPIKDVEETVLARNPAKG